MMAGLLHNVYTVYLYVHFLQSAVSSSGYDYSLIDDSISEKNDLVFSINGDGKCNMGCAINLFKFQYFHPTVLEAGKVMFVRCTYLLSAYFVGTDCR